MDETSSPVAGQTIIETRITDYVRVGVVTLIAYWSYTLAAPFILIVIWAAILTVSLYPFYLMLRALLGERPRLAALLLTVLSLGIIIGPLTAIALNFLQAIEWLLGRLAAGSLHVPPPPEVVRTWPIVGERIHNAWGLASSNLEDALAPLQETLLQTGQLILGKSAAVGLGLLSFLASVIIAGFFFGHGAKLAEGVNRVAERIAGNRGHKFVQLAGATIRNVASGVIGVAVIQTLLAGIVLRGFAIPGSGGLTFAILILCIIQIGPALVLLPVVIWAWMTQDFTYALPLTLLLIPVAIIDNVMRIFFMSRGLSTPMLVIFMGVIGGTLAYGLIGLFLGPIVLSVFYDLLVAWVNGPASPQEQTAKQNVIVRD